MRKKDRDINRVAKKKLSRVGSAAVTGRSGNHGNRLGPEKGGATLPRLASQLRHCAAWDRGNGPPGGRKRGGGRRKTAEPDRGK